MGREDLIGNGKRHLVPTWQPKDSGVTKEGGRMQRKGEQGIVKKAATKGPHNSSQQKTQGKKRPPVKKAVKKHTKSKRRHGR